MQLFPLLAAAFLLPVQAQHFRRQFGELSVEKKARMFQGRGDPEQRRARLEKLGSRRHRNMTEEQKAMLRERLTKLVPIKMQDPNGEESVDLFEVNAKEGVDKYLYNGDINLTEEQLKHIEEVTKEEENGTDSTRPKRQATSIFPKWAGNTVYFYFDTTKAAITAKHQYAVMAALQYLQSRTCLNFVQSSTAPNRIKVFNGDGCYSDVGMIGGVQVLSLGNGCESIGTIAHEFAHSLGIWHTQMRSDRDSYVTIDLTLVPGDMQFNFGKLTSAENLILTPYEYGSMMHYRSNSFSTSNDKLSIVPKDMRYAYSMGNRQISFYDFMMINKYYGCDAICPAVTSAQCKNGGVPNPRNCATCDCPLGYGGTLCDERPAGCGETLTATSTWQSKQYTYGDAANKFQVRDGFAYCNHWIQAPVGQCVEVQITEMVNSWCQFGCGYNGIEIKGDPDQRMSNPRYCCEEFINKTFTTTLNPTPIISYNRHYITTFTIEYRAVACAPAPRRQCKSMNTASNCAANIANGFCTNPQYSFIMRKYNCALECGFCGQAGPVCADNQSNCAIIKVNGLCNTMDPMQAEYSCQKTCGFCDLPN